jgi:hypothetical protein
MRSVAIVVTAALLSPLAVPADQPESDRKHFFKHTFGPTAVARAAAGAGISQLNNTPSEWGQGMLGFGRRFASSFGFHIVKKGIEYPVAKLRHEEFGYHPSDKEGFKPRMVYALEAVVITHKTTDHSKTVHTAELSSAFGAGFISRLWQPASTRTIGAGFSSAGLTLAIDAGTNVLHEFWPEIRHPHTHVAVRAQMLEKRRREVLGKEPEEIATEPSDECAGELD